MIYNILLLFYCLFSFPKILWERIILGKKRSHLLQRLGIKKYSLSIPSDKKVVWIHAVSVGEIKAALSLVKHIKQQISNAFLIVSTTTDTGYEEAKKTLSCADTFLFFPIDFSWTVKKLLKNISLNVVIFIESDFWYNFLKYSKAKKAKICLVSGKVSEKSARRFQWFSFFSKKLFSYFDMICTQNDLYKQRFMQIFPSSQNVLTTGNLKYNNKPESLSLEKLSYWQEQLYLQPEDIVITIGSTHDNEEEMLLKGITELLQQQKHIKLLLVPRHSERCRGVEKMLKRKNFTYGVFSKRHLLSSPKQILLIDAMGYLALCYQLSQLAIIGGSFIDRVGGHNILEAIFFQVPVIFGPHMKNQKDLERLILEKQSGFQIEHHEVPSLVKKLITDKKKLKELQTNCILLQNALQSTLETTWTAISSLF